MLGNVALLQLQVEHLSAGAQSKQQFERMQLAYALKSDCGL